VQMKQNLNQGPLEKRSGQSYTLVMNKISLILAVVLVLGSIAPSFAQRARTTTSTNMVTTTTNTTTKVISPP